MPQGGSAGEGEGGNGKVQFFDAELKCSFFFFCLAFQEVERHIYILVERHNTENKR